MAKQVYIKNDQIPFGWSFEACDFINKVRNVVRVDDKEEAGGEVRSERT
jgi:hypothetical protein